LDSAPVPLSPGPGISVLSSAELLLQVLELALKGVESRQGHRVVLRGEVDGYRVRCPADWLE
jgi:hypothetical protein